MSRYKCPACSSEWSTGNMAPVCGRCFCRLRDMERDLRIHLGLADKVIDSARKLRQEYNLDGAWRPLFADLAKDFEVYDAALKQQEAK